MKYLLIIQMFLTTGLIWGSDLNLYDSLGRFSVDSEDFNELVARPGVCSELHTIFLC